MVVKVNIRAFRDQLLGRLYPAACLLCGAQGVGTRELCGGCYSDLPWNHKACARCALPLPAGVFPPALCAHCLQQPPIYDSAWAPLRYEKPLDWLITGLKFHQRLGNARLLGELASGLAPRRPKQKPDLLIPVPLHESRLKTRGYNQALELARPIARTLNIPLDVSGCVRTRATAAQSELDVKHRAVNVRGAFACSLNLVKKHVVIVDDVVTTGHTVNEFARVLKRAGAARIEVWSLTRTSRPGS
ncbi:MAG: ComF family protein [Nevskiales bacterium]